MDDIECTRCGQVQDAGAFYLASPQLVTKGHGRRQPCRACCRTARVERYQRARHRVDDTVDGPHAQRRQGLTVEQYRAMHDAQEGRCAACRQPTSGGQRLHVDHDRRSGAARALLCSGCDAALGAVRDDPDRLLALVAYLRRPARPTP